jgi:hypothetical protein
MDFPLLFKASIKTEKNQPSRSVEANIECIMIITWFCLTCHMARRGFQV